MFEFERDSTVIISEKLKARFCKDIGLPIKIYCEPYFENFIRLFDNQYNSIEKYADFIKTVETFGSEEAFLKAYNELKEKVINYLKDNPIMMFFSQKEDLNKYSIKNCNISAKDVYIKDNDGQIFVSIDMIKANFSALYHYNPMIFRSRSTYEDFMKMFTSISYFISSKHIRQVIFGNVNPKRQVTYEKYLMDMVLTKLIETGCINKDNIYSFSNDEIIIRVPATTIPNAFIFTIEEIVKWANDNNIFIRYEFFELKAIPGCKGFVKKFIYDKKGIDFKCVDSLMMPFVLRAYNGEPVNELDKVFIHDGKKAKLLENFEIEAV